MNAVPRIAPGRWLIAALSLACLAPASLAQMTVHVAEPTGRPNVYQIQFGTMARAIPDASLSGLTDSRVVSGLPGFIESLALLLTITGTDSGAFNGDYFGYVSHGGRTAVLLNRAGRRADNPVGYADNGFSAVRFEDAAPAGDVHVYRLTLFGDHYTELDPYQSPLTGTWAPDGRATSPSSVVSTDARTSLLSTFNGMDGNGTWTLFLADLESGGTGRLANWSLEVTAVPEPAACGIAMGFTALAFGLWRSRQQKAATDALTS